MYFNITSKVIGYAIHRIFVAHELTPGMSMPLRTLMEAWPGSMLRRTDLGTGLDALKAQGCIAIEPSPNGPLVRLLKEDFALVRNDKDRDALALLKRVRDLRQKPVSFVSNIVVPGARPAQPMTRRLVDRKRLQQQQPGAPT